MDHGSARPQDQSAQGALLRSQVIRMGGGLLEGSALDSFYVAAPVLSPDSFAVLKTTDPPTVIVWLVPIASAEADLAESRGWAWFEQELVARLPPLMDLGSAAIVH